MPVYKFKSFEDAEKALWNFTPDENYFQRISEFWDFANELNPINYPKGVFKFETFLEAKHHRDNIEIAHAKKKREKTERQKN